MFYKKNTSVKMIFKVVNEIKIIHFKIFLVDFKL